MESVMSIAGSPLLSRAVSAEAAPAPAMPAAAGLSTPEGEGAAPAPAAAAPDAQATAALNALLQQHQQHLAFSVDEASGLSVLRVIDTASGDVIRQMPGESWVKLARELAENGSGLLRTQA